MSCSSSNDVPEFNSIQDELVYWKNRSQQFEQEVRQLKLKRSIKCVIGDDQENTEKDPVKKTRFDDHYEMDPFKLFPQHCQEIILNQLNGMDLYNMSKVSDYWKLIVESDKKAADKLKKVVTICSEDYDYRGRSYSYNGYDNEDDFFCSDAIKLRYDGVKEKKETIEYAHAKMTTNCFDLVSIYKHSASLLTVKISENLFEENASSCLEQLLTSSPALDLKENFPRLRKLYVSFSDLNFLKMLSDCTFPALIELNLSFIWHYREFYYSEFTLSDMLYSLHKNAPNLKHLHLSDDMVRNHHEDEKEIHLPLASIDAPFRLQSLSLESFCEHIIEFHAQTLTNFKINAVSMKGLNFILKNLSKLESLTIGHVYQKKYYSKEEIPSSMITHTGITKFKYFENEIQSSYLPFPTIELLGLLPSLETFILRQKLTTSLLLFMAHNHHCLKEIICDGIEENLMEAYEDLKHDVTENVETNKNIKIVINEKAQNRYYY